MGLHFDDKETIRNERGRTDTMPTRLSYEQIKPLTYNHASVSSDQRHVII